MKANPSLRLFPIFSVLALFLSSSHGQVPGGGTVKVEMGPNLVTARMNQSVANLPDGRIVVFGGHGQGFVTLNTAEVYDPATGAFTSVAMKAGHDSPGVFARLKDGRYLIGGGSADLGIPQYAACEIFNPQTGTFSDTGSMVRFRAMGGAGTLTDGRVLVAGGWWTHNDANTYGELYDPSAGAFRATGALNLPRAWPYVLPTTDGKAVVVGGFGYTGGAISPTPELYDPQSNAFTKLADDLFPGESGWTLIPPQSTVDECRLNDGRFLLLGYRAVESKTVYGLIVFDPGTHAFSKFTTTPTIPDSTSMSWWLPLLNANRTVAYLPGYPSADSTKLNLLKVDLATGSIAMPAESASRPQVYSFYGSTFSLLGEGQVLIIGGTPGDNFSALSYTTKLTATYAPAGPVLDIAMYAGITITGEVGTNYRVEYASDPSGPVWTTLTNLTLPASPYLLFDPTSARATGRVYRAAKSP